MNKVLMIGLALVVLIATGSVNARIEATAVAVDPTTTTPPAPTLQSIDAMGFGRLVQAGMTTP